MSTTTLTDAQLGARAVAGDRDAFGELFARHERGLVEVAHRMTGSREDAADIAQEAFLRVFARLDALAGRDVDLAAYLHRTARNLVYDRSARHARETPVQDVEAIAGADPGLEGDPERTGLVSDQADRVRAANARLPERHRLVLALRELEGMGYASIGRVLDITPGAVAQLLVRARAALRRELRLQQVDLDAIEPGCRARLADIGALIDGELDADRARVLTDHMAGCAACTAARAAFEDAGRRYRAWLPLPLVLGLGAETARAAAARGLVRLRDAAPHAPAGGVPSRIWAGASRGRMAGLLGGGAAAVALVVAVPVLVATRSGSSSPPPPAVAPVAAQPGTTAAAPPSPVTTAAAPTTTAPPGAAPAAPEPVAAAAPAASPVTAAPPPAAAPPAPATTRTAPPRPAPRPAVTAAGGTTAPPAAAAPPAPAPPAQPAPADPAPPATTAVPEDPPPPATTRDTPPDIPFPTTIPSLPPP